MKCFVPQTLPERFFAALSAIPRLSEYEAAAADYVVSIAQKLGLRHRRDAMHNVVVWKNAAPGYESAPEVMLQAHLDMVGVSSSDVDHDFTRDPLTLLVDEQGKLRARGTTLGADDGYGCAYLLSALEESFPHPSLVCVFTAQEENGCYGAAALDCSDISARRMIGLDVMGSDIEYICCVGGYCSDRLILTRECIPAACADPALCVEVRGVQPVAVGALVHPEQGNAIKMAARLLARLRTEGIAFRLAELSGGTAENYCPVTCQAVIAVPDPVAAETALRDEFRPLEAELQDGSQALALTISPAVAECALSEVDSLALADLLDLIPSGTFEISPSDQKMIATNNVGLVSLSGGSFRLIASNRARTLACKDGLNRRVAALARLTGCTLKVEKRYEPWEYGTDSPLRAVTASLMQEIYGHEMEEFICPGGLEISDLLPKMPGLDSVMFAPIGGGSHTTGEWMSLGSFNRTYDFLKALLGRLKDQ